MGAHGSTSSSISISTSTSTSSSNSKNTTANTSSTEDKEKSTANHQQHTSTGKSTRTSGVDHFLLSSESTRGLLSPDRVALACRLLNDKQLAHFCATLAASVVQEGRLDGLLFTGFGEEGLGLLQRYVDHTGDVQTASLLCASRVPVSDRRVLRWTEAYRSLLDCWQLWHVRARFDGVIRRQSGSSSHHHHHHHHQRQSQHHSRALQPQVFVRCNYCNKVGVVCVCCVCV
jgi:hypothetical protein